MNKLFLVITLILLCSLAFAQDPSITNVSYPSETLVGTTETLTVTIDPNDENGTLWLYQDGQPITHKDFNIYSPIITFEQTWQLKGNKQMKAQLLDINSIGNDTNNDKQDFNIQVYNGVDLKPTLITITPTQLLPDQNITIESTIQNVGDKAHLGTIQVQFTYDGILIDTQEFLDLTATQLKNIQTTFLLPSNFSGEHIIGVKVNPLQTITEFAYTNNNLTKTISDSTNPEIVVSEIISNSVIRKNNLANFETTIQNNGGTNANNVLVKMYHTSINEQNKIYETTITSLQSYTQQTLSFSFSFANTGTDKIIVYADPLNHIVEQEENNNTFELTVEILDENIEYELASTLFFDVYSECVTYISNGDRFLVNSINDVNNTISFDYYDSEGRTIISEENAGAGFEMITPGRTIRIIDIDNGLVKMFLVYQQEVSVQYTSCDIDLTNVLGDKEQCERAKNDYKTSLESCTIERSAAQKSLANIENERQACQSELGVCNTHNSTYLSNAAKQYDANSSFWENKYLMSKDECENEKRTVINNENKKTVGANGEAGLWRNAFLLMVFLVVAWAVYEELLKDKIRKGKPEVSSIYESG
jgi:hypothetical protein